MSDSEMGWTVGPQVPYYHARGAGVTDGKSDCISLRRTSNGKFASDPHRCRWFLFSSNSLKYLLYTQVLVSFHYCHDTMAQDGLKRPGTISTGLPPTPPDSEQSDEDISRSSPAIRTPEFCLPPETSEPTEILEADQKTPDRWLPRDSRLIRLTGVHPFNVEAPLTDLFNEGFLTSPELFYVRNHGPVPQVKDDDIPDWTFSVEGMVEKPFTLSLQELLEQYEQRTWPITLVCAGNRRKVSEFIRLIVVSQVLCKGALSSD